VTAYDVAKERSDEVSIEETAKALKQLLDSGKIKAYGLSNETTFGVCEWARVAKELGMPGPATIQNSFSLMHRSFETELAEACSPKYHNVGLLPWSALCGGLLTGKYLEANCDPESRHMKYVGFQARWSQANSMTERAVVAYVQLAKEYGMSPTALALAWCRTRWYVASTIIGARTLPQLKECIDALDPAAAPTLSEELLAKVDQVHLQAKDPFLLL
jgi:aryl-alcohol dehydrogenase-like predicted oxidoreductase